MQPAAFFAAARQRHIDATGQQLTLDALGFERVA
jgi:hypothetical protein